ncbi:SDR family oxidoreductase [Paracrocinitomix mangrovi]|uniref:SDR family oxidoreductase n=1 Tax=Paracrocinitomix mangrovi TaxID=2862509 RepID=UPI001C8DDADB|nr:SDR family oxidoreductase [Paracrocinitomix mangrovi]UKN02619.1 SDR family oxidoreductase [Paracrocinitomix mangrovi]
MDIAEKVYIVTGGSSGLGKAFAHELVMNLSNVVITGRDLEKLKDVASSLGSNCLWFHADMTSDEDIDKLIDFTLNKFGKIDGIINNAGIGVRTPIEELSREKMREVYEVNVFGAAMLASKVTPLFKKQKYGDIVNIASTAAMKGYATGSIYSSSKFALRSMSQSWAAELRPFNVRVISINPSEVPTAFGQEDRVEKELAENKLRPQEIADVLIAALKMDRRGYIPEVSVFATNPF